MKQVVTGGSVVLFGSGRQTRDFVYISDVVDALVSAGKARGVERAILNIGSGVEVSISGLVDTVERVTGLSGHRLYNREAGVGASRLVADITSARKKLGFKPRIGLPEGLRLTIAQGPRFSLP